jgi:hypothetical protein
MEKFYVVCNNTGRVFHRVTNPSMAEVLKAVEILYGNSRLLTVLTEEEYHNEQKLNALENETHQ